ncbi:MAG: hypothetical protein ABEJ42_06675 [Halobacteriaceae archaeon]
MAVTLALLSAAVAPASAHVGALGGSADPGPVPTWLVVVTGGVVVAGSFLATTFVTDRRDVDLVAGLYRTVAVPRRLASAGAAVGGALGVLGLLAVLASGVLGPTLARANLAVLLVWTGWWAGYTMTVYGAGDTWGLVNPWATLVRGARWALDGVTDPPRVAYPDRLGAWPAVAGLVVFVFLEVVSPLATDPRLLAAVVAGYTVVTLTGAVLVGPRAWFGNVDPVSRVFALYGRLAPVRAVDPTDADPNAGRTTLAVGLPGVHLCTPDRPLGADETALVVALLWVTSFDGLVSTPAWNDLARAVVGAGVPPLALYAAVAVAGLAVFHRAYAAAARWATRTADTYVTPRYLAGWFAAALLPIAAGYHVAHFLAYLLRLLPALWGALWTPLSAAPVTVVVVPSWFGVLQLGFVVAGHLAAVWIAHAASFRLFPGRLQPLESQYPFVLVMVGYTVASMWIVAQPYVAPAYL